MLNTAIIKDSLKRIEKNQEIIIDLLRRKPSQDAVSVKVKETVTLDASGTSSQKTKSAKKPEDKS